MKFRDNYLILHQECKNAKLRYFFKNSSNILRFVDLT